MACSAAQLSCAGKTALQRPPGASEGAREEFGSVAQAFLVDRMADPLRQVPLHRNAERGKRARGVKQRLRRDTLVLVAMDEQGGWARFDLVRQRVSARVGRQDQQA